MARLFRLFMFVMAWCPTRAQQDPLANDYFGAGAGGDPRSGFAQSPRGPIPPSPPSGARSSSWFRTVMIMAGGAGAMRVVDAARERNARRRNDQEMDAMKTAMDFKRIENKQLNYKVQQLEYRVKELQQALYESEAEALQRDYDEFKAPDLDNDDVISKAEFSSYIKNYMKAYPQIPEDEYPTFEEFDIDGNGVVTFEEWQRYLQLQNKKESSSSSRQGAAAASRKSNAGRGGGANSAGGAAGGYGADDSFQSLYEKLRSI